MLKSDDSVLVIGNGPSVVDFLTTDIVSEYDIVVRINRGYFEGIDKYQDVIGTRTDMLYIHDGFCNTQWFDKRSVENVEVWVVIPNFKYDMKTAIQHTYPNFKFVPPSIQTVVTTKYNFEGRWPTTGLECLLHLCEKFSNVTTVGFDNNTELGKKYDNYHFYQHTDKRTMEDMSKNRPDHMFLLERVIINSLLNENKLKSL